MTPRWISPLGLHYSRWLPALGLVLVAACDATSIPGRPALAIREETAQFRSVPASGRWVAVPNALLVQERDLGGDVEQRIALPNGTSVRGDNVMVLRARAAHGTGLPRLQLAEFADAEGRLPEPFERTGSGDLRAAEDALGPVVHAEQRLGGDTVCVLALRRMPPTARPLPPRTEALDVMLRHCVRGSAEEALRPVTAESLGFPGAGEATEGPARAGRTRSPLAAPLP